MAKLDRAPASDALLISLKLGQVILIPKALNVK